MNEKSRPFINVDNSKNKLTLPHPLMVKSMCLYWACHSYKLVQIETNWASSNMVISIWCIAYYVDFKGVVKMPGWDYEW